MDDEVALFITGGGRHNDFRHLPAIGPRIHVRRTTDGAGDAAGKFHARKAMSQCFSRHADSRDTTGDTKRISFSLNSLHATGADHSAADAFIVNQKIRPAAQNEKRYPMLMGHFDHKPQLLHGFRHQKTIRRTTDAKGGVTAHGFIYFYLIFPKNTGKNRSAVIFHTISFSLCVNDFIYYK